MTTPPIGRQTLTTVCAAAALILIVPVGGCNGPPSREPPKTYPVQGKVKYANGTPVSKGLIEFRSETEPVVASGQIQADGSFTLKTGFGNGHLDGAVAGKHRVTFHPFQGQDQTQAPYQPPVMVAELVTVEPGEQNAITIRIN